MIRQQLLLVSMSFCMGMLIVLVYDILIIIREILRLGKVLCGITDFVFWELAAVVLYIVTYRINGGVIRGYALGALFLGMILFTWSVGTRFIAISRKVLKKINAWFTIVSCKVKTKFNR